jgi:MFS family permease
MALFCIPVGALLAMGSISRFIQRYGAGRVTIVMTCAYSLSMMLPFLASNLWTLGGALFVVGIASASMDIAMNAVAATLQKEHETVIMSTCHGFFSLGGMIGAGLGSGCIALGFQSIPQMGGAIALALLVTWIAVRPVLLPMREAASTDEGALQWPGRALAGLAFIGFCSMQGEGAIVDWSAIFLHEIREAEDYLSGLGYAGFSLSMTLGRFSGDHIMQRFSPRPILLGSFLVVMAGLVIVVMTARPWESILGFTLAGAGYALLVPIVFSEAAARPNISPSQGIAAVASSGYVGFLLGPVVIGGIAEISDLTYGFGYLILLTGLALLVSSFALGRSSLPKA